MKSIPSRSLPISGQAFQENPRDRTLVIRLGREAAGRRADQALATHLPEHSRTQLGRWMRQGRVRSAGRCLKPSERLRGGETLEVSIPPPPTSHLQPEDRPLDILYEDDALLALNKPSGLTVHPGSGRRSGTLANALLHYLRSLPRLGGEDRPGIVHRLDRETSGVMVVAKTEMAWRRIARAFAERKVTKCYVALVHGADIASAGEIAQPIARSRRNRQRMAVVPSGGRDALTCWRVQEVFARHALLEVRPHTGRTHQIRVHLRALGHPILGDRLYGRQSLPGEDEAPRLLLHAHVLELHHPLDQVPLRFEAPLPVDFVRAIGRLRSRSDPTAPGSA